MSKPTRQAFTLIQLVFAVIAIALILRVALHVGYPAATTNANNNTPKTDKLVLRGDHTPGLMKNHAIRDRFARTQGPQHTPATEQQALRDRVADGRGPLLARVVGQVHPGITETRLSDGQTDRVVETLPPGESPRAILLIPSTEKPEDEDKSRPCPPRAAEDDTLPETADADPAEDCGPIMADG